METYCYEMRERVEGRLKDFMADADRTAFVDLLRETGDVRWRAVDALCVVDSVVVGSVVVGECVNVCVVWKDSRRRYVRSHPLWLTATNQRHQPPPPVALHRGERRGIT